MFTRQLLCPTLILVLSSPLIWSAEGPPLVLHDATPVRMRLNRTISSADATDGETLDLEVLDDVKIGNTLIIARGAVAIATITEAQAKRRLGRGGKLDVNIDYVRTVNGDKIALRAVKEVKGGGHTGAMTGAMVATSLVFWPAAPFFLFMHGKDITIPKGTEITAYTNGEITFAPANSAPAQVAPAIPAAVLPQPAPALPLAAPSPAVVTPAPMTSAPMTSAPNPTLSAPVPASVAAATSAPLVPMASAPGPAAFRTSGSPSLKNAEPTKTRPQSDEENTVTVTLPGAPRRKLVNADIIALKQAGFGDGVIISKINASGANYKLDIKDLLQLKKANISDQVIAAMIEASKQ